jgi:hypothetical protein
VTERAQLIFRFKALVDGHLDELALIGKGR